jgi:serine/threonine protein kinase
MDDRRSERFGRYEILAELGRGAMGVVYKARDPKINRVVAVKTVSLVGQSPEEEREYRERFYREAEAAGRLSHPGIVTIFDVGEEPETRAPYIVMEYVGGQSLDKLLLSCGENKLPVATALQLTLELAEALDCAHGQGVVHRDLKPANILLTEDGHPKISDFGVAKLNLGNQTLAGRALGTPAFMSPEQLNGEAVDGRSDLFSLGVVLYTILTGYRPFQGNSAITISFKVVNRDPIPATLLDTELPQGLDYIIARAMAKDPAERYQRGMEIVFDIQELRAGREPWSKAKLQGSRQSRNAARMSNARNANEKARPALGHPWIAAQIVASARSLHWPHRAGDLQELLRRKSVAARIVLAGLLIAGVWGVSAELGRVRREAPALPWVSQVSAVKITAPVPAPSSAQGTAASLATAPAPNTQALVLKSVPAKEIHSSSMDASSIKVARANLRPLSTATLTSAAVTPAAVTPATLVIEVDHRFAEAHLSIWVDDRLSYEHGLEGRDKKHLVVFHHVEGHETHAMQLSAGKHRLRAQVTSDEGSYDQSATVAGEFISGQENVLRIGFSKSGAMNVSLQ